MIKLTIRILRKLSIINYFNFSYRKKVGANIYKIPILGKLGISNMNTWEPWMLELLQIVIKMGNEKFIDVGANVGQTLLSIKSISPDIDYIGFEPNPSCNFYLENLIRQNKIRNAEIIPVAISEKNDLGQLDFYSELSEDAAASIIDNLRPTNKIYKRSFVPILTIETIKKKVNLEKMSILKIDVEGSELEVLLSFRDKIMENNPIILLEILPIYRIERKESLRRQQAIEALMKEIKYCIYRVIKTEDRLMGLEKKQELEIHSDINLSDYVCVPQSRSEELENHCSKISIS